jgi:hypothetical protein
MHLLRSKAPLSTAGWRPRERPFMPSTSISCSSAGAAARAALRRWTSRRGCRQRLCSACLRPVATWITSQAVMHRPHFKHLRMVGACSSIHAIGNISSSR